MSERIEQAVSRLQKWSIKNYHWIVLVVVTINIADLALSSKHEPVSYWLSWFLIVTGIIILIQWPNYRRKIEKAQSEKEQDKSSDSQ